MNEIKNPLLGANYHQFKIRFFILTIVCFIPVFALLIAGYFLDYWKDFPTLGVILFLILILSIVVAALTYRYFKNNFFSEGK